MTFASRRRNDKLALVFGKIALISGTFPLGPVIVFSISGSNNKCQRLHVRGTLALAAGGDSQVFLLLRLIINVCLFRFCQFLGMIKCPALSFISGDRTL